jgi:hypothetical protein
MALGADSLPGWRGRHAADQPEKREDQAVPTPDQADEAPAETVTGSTTTTGGGRDNEPVVVWQAPNRLEAQIVKGRLESHGIPAFLSGEALGTIYGLTTGSLAATSVLVPGPLAEKALEILNSQVEWDESLWEDVEDERWAGEDSGEDTGEDSPAQGS